jgi:hypothetical protein
MAISALQQHPPVQKLKIMKNKRKDITINFFQSV